MKEKKANKKILIIEDEKPLARALEIKLTHEGFEVFRLANGEGFSSMIKGNNFSLIIADLIMPVYDGFTILETMKEHKIKIPIFILTNLSQKEDEKKVMELGATKFFVKAETSLSKIVDYIKNIK